MHASASVFTPYTRKVFLTLFHLYHGFNMVRSGLPCAFLANALIYPFVVLFVMSILQFVEIYFLCSCAVSSWLPIYFAITRLVAREGGTRGTCRDPQADQNLFLHVFP